MKNLIALTFALIGSILLLSCKKNHDEAPAPQDQNESELITTVSLIITEQGVLIDTFSFKDPDGAGGIAPTVENLTLAAGKTYTCTLLLLDETKNPVDTTSLEIEEEKDAHQFFYDPSFTTNLTVNYGDFDNHFVPIGLRTTFVTGAASTGTLKIILKHQPGLKPTSGNGNIALGETDLEVSFDVTIQ